MFCTDFVKKNHSLLEGTFLTFCKQVRGWLYAPRVSCGPCCMHPVCLVRVAVCTPCALWGAGCMHPVCLMGLAVWVTRQSIRLSPFAMEMLQKHMRDCLHWLMNDLQHHESVTHTIFGCPMCSSCCPMGPRAIALLPTCPIPPAI